MNKIMKENVKEEASKVKLCLLGQVSTDIRNRLPDKPDQLNSWEKYKLIKSGEAKLDKTIKMLTIMDDNNYSAVKLVNAFTYPKSEEQKTWDTANKAIQDEKNKRELAVENAIRHVVAQALLEVISMVDYLKELDNLASQKW